MSADLTVRLPESPRFAILTEGALGVLEAKTAVCVLRYRPDDVVALIDSTHAGRTAQSVVGVGGSVPVVARVEEARALGADTLLIGIAPRGGGLPAEWRPALLRALESGMHLVSGLHVMLEEDAEIARAAAAHGRRLVDLRRVPFGAILPAEEPEARRGAVVLTVGTDCAVGKLTASLQVAAALSARGRDAVVGATGQTGVLLTGWGIAIDRVISDFAAGWAEAIVDHGLARADVVVVEGQGSIIHPAYSGVACALLHGARPDVLVLCHQPTRREIRGYGVPLPPLPEFVRLYEALAAPVHPARVAALALNTFDLTPEAAERACRAAEDATGLPAEDPVRMGGDRIAAAVDQALDGLALRSA